jgi:multiple sugar transport system substrate-binding protein
MVGPSMGSASMGTFEVEENAMLRNRKAQEMALAYRLNRRKLLKGASATAVAAAAMGVIPSVMRPGHFVKAQGQLNVLAPQWPQVPKEEQLAAEVFAAETGITVTFEAVNYATLEQRIKLLVESASSDYDIYDYDSQWLGGFVAAGALERLDVPEYLGSADATISIDDFFPEITGRLVRYPNDEADLTAAINTEAPVYGLPWSLNAQALWYRTDLMDSPPETWEELRETAAQLTDDSIFGYAVQGGRDADWIISETNPIFWSNGGELWDQQTYTAEGILDSPENIESLQFFVDLQLVDGSIDPASANWTINERLGALLTGRAAMCLNWAPLFGGIADDPNTSQVVGNIGYAPSPAGSVTRASMIGCQGTAINSGSQNKEAAWQYLQWFQSPETQRAIVEDIPSGFVSARNDLRDAAVHPWQQVFLEMIPDLRDMWNIPEYAQLLQALQTELNLAYVGRKTPEEALRSAALAQQAVLDNSPDNPANQA